MTGSPRSERIVSRSPSWVRTPRSSGARMPSGSVAPSKRSGPAAGEGSSRAAARTTAPRARIPATKSAISTRGFTRRSVVAAWRRALRLDQPAPYRVAHELDAIAHPELGQHVPAVGLDGLLRQVQRLGDLAVRVGLGDQLDHLELPGGEFVPRAGAPVLEPLPHQGSLGGGAQ